ncbi:MAG: hypothetical protein WAV02_23690 [Stellaceae bacterium]
MHNILVNGGMLLDELNEGAEVPCHNALGSATPVASRWYVQFLAEGASATAQRVFLRGGSGLSAAAASRITITRPAPRVTGLDRLQLFQPVVYDELVGALGDIWSGDGEAGEAGSLPLAMTFAIMSNIDLDVGCTLNAGDATRNWTTNRHVTAGKWQGIEVAIEADSAGPFRCMSGIPIALYFQIGLSCGPDRLTTVDGEWNDGHSLMVESATTSQFMTTPGATVWIADCALRSGTAPTAPPEPPALARLRVERYEEKSYWPGVRPGTPGAQDGAYQFRAVGDQTEDRVVFRVQKQEQPKRAVSKVYSPTTGAADFAYDVVAQCDVPAEITETNPGHMIVSLPSTVPGHIYRYHWRATTMV